MLHSSPLSHFKFHVELYQLATMVCKTLRVRYHYAATHLQFSQAGNILTKNSYYDHTVLLTTTKAIFTLTLVWVRVRVIVNTSFHLLQ